MKKSNNTFNDNFDFYINMENGASIMIITQ
jgi:hypothetical protein